jgi:hypothetical protein
VATAAKLLVDQEERVDRQSAGTRWLSEQNLRRKAEDGLRARAEQEVRDRRLRGAVLMVLIAVLGLICLGVAV